MQNSFFFYDYETTGIDPRSDRIIQFAGIRTDESFDIIAEPIAEYCQLSPEIIPNPEALLVTGIDYTTLKTKGLVELDFLRLIFKEFSTPYTTVAGYNNIRFDDEFTRYGFYRNFYDPYSREWQNNNSRWDLIDVVRMCAALRPSGINWPVNSDGKPSFKLEEITKANNISHTHAHDALSDVYATIELAKLIKNHQPKLLQYLLNCRRKDFIKNLINLDNTADITDRILVHSSRMISSEFYATSLVLPLINDPVNNNGYITWDLRYDPEVLLNLDGNLEKAKYLLYTPQDELNQEAGEKRLALKNIFINKVPAVAPLVTVDAAAYDRIKLDKSDILARAQVLVKNFDSYKNLLLELYSIKPDFDTPDVEHALYDKFIPNNDKYICNRVHITPDDKLAELESKFSDERLKELLFRYRARNFYGTLSIEEKIKWQNYCQTRLENTQNIASISKQEFLDKSTQLMGENKDEKDILASWIVYISTIENKINDESLVN